MVANEWVETMKFSSMGTPCMDASNSKTVGSAQTPNRKFKKKTGRYKKKTGLQPPAAAAAPCRNHGPQIVRTSSSCRRTWAFEDEGSGESVAFVAYMRGKDPPKYLEGAGNCQVNPVDRVWDSLILGMIIVCTVDIVTSKYNKSLLLIFLNHYHHSLILSLRTVMFLLLCTVWCLSSVFFVLLVLCQLLS